MKNVIVILNSIFEYGFIRARGKFTSGEDTFSEDEEEDDYDVEFESNRRISLHKGCKFIKSNPVF